MSVKITIGTAVYNVREAFLRAHLDSIIHQLTDEAELLLIDDCSTDNSGQVCMEYARKDSRIRYIKQEKNSGLSHVRNVTIDEARGDWIFFADGDDILSDYFIETALAFCDTKYDIIIHNRQIFSDKKPCDESPCGVKKLNSLPKDAGRNISISCLCTRPLDGGRYNMGNDAYYHAAWGAVYKRQFLKDSALVFPEGQRKAQDSVFNTYAYFCADNIAHLPYTMYYYRKDMQGITERYCPDYLDMITPLIQHHGKCMETLYPNDKTIMEYYKTYRVISFAFDAMRQNFFHKDNPKSRNERKKDFLEFVETEPFKSAITDFDIKGCKWWDWRLTVGFAQKKDFSILDLMSRHPLIYKITGKFNALLYSFFN